MFYSFFFKAYLLTTFKICYLQLKQFYDSSSLQETLTFDSKKFFKTALNSHKNQMLTTLMSFCVKTSLEGEPYSSYSWDSPVQHLPACAL